MRADDKGYDVKNGNELATEITEFADPAPAFGAGGKNLKISVRGVARNAGVIVHHKNILLDNALPFRYHRFTSTTYTVRERDSLEWQCFQKTWA